MKADEYDLFLEDMSDYLATLPFAAHQRSISSSGQIPPLTSLLDGLPFGSIATPEFESMAEQLLKISGDAVKWTNEIIAMYAGNERLRFPGPVSDGRWLGTF